MNPEKKYNLITRNLQEVLGEDALKAILAERDPIVYWGTATTGKPHIAYFLPLLKIRDFVTAGCKVKILLADVHAFLDNLKAPIELIGFRSQYYEEIIKSMLGSIKVDLTKLEFVKGSSYQKSPEYIMDLYRLSTLTTEHDARKAGSMVVKQVNNPTISSLLYPGMQMLDEEHLGVDIQFGGVDQRKIFTYAKKYLPMLGYKKRIHLMNPMIDGLNEGKMSASDIFSKIDLIDSHETIKSKIKKSYCNEGEIKGGIFQLLRIIVFPILKIQEIKYKITDLNKNTRDFDSYEELETAFINKEIHPGDLKSSFVDTLDNILKPIRNHMLSKDELVTKSYPEK